MIYLRCDDASEWVQLNPLEWRGAVITGKWIWRYSHRDGRKDRDDWQGFKKGKHPGRRQQILGSLCERIAAKCLGIYWPSAFNNFSRADLPHDVEVRLIGADTYGLRVYPRNADHLRVIGVVIPRGSERGEPRGSYRFRVAGWRFAKDGKQPCWEMAPHGRPPMYCVPQDQLHHPATLRALILREKEGRLDALPHDPPRPGEGRLPLRHDRPLPGESLRSGPLLVVDAERPSHPTQQRRDAALLDVLRRAAVSRETS